MYFNPGRLDSANTMPIARSPLKVAECNVRMNVEMAKDSGKGRWREDGWSASGI